MNASVYHLAFPNLLLILIPVLVVTWIYFKWSLGFQTILYATLRMVIQLLTIGFLLIFIFESRSAVFICAILSVMLFAAGWIAVRPVGRENRARHYGRALLALAAGGVTTLLLVIVLVIRLEPWYDPRYLIPIAGMIFANAMNSVSLAAERFQAERRRKTPLREARGVAYQAALLPLLNSFFAVGLVSLPGMMTGQILSGISPLVAVRYQMMVMGMLLGASGIAAAVYLTLESKERTP